jgi:D-xylose transport system substrate-binding protein
MLNRFIPFLIVFCFLSCSMQNKRTVGLLLPDLKIEFYKKNEKYFRERAKELGLEVAVLDAGGNEDVQFKQALELINNGVKVIIICSVNANLSAAIVREAHNKDVKIIAYDRLIRNSDLDYYISHDNIKVGEVMTDYAIKIKPKGNYMLLFGDRTDQNALFVRQGMENILNPLVKNGSIKIVYKSYVEGWDANEAYFEVDRFLHFSKDSLNVVLAASDDISLGVVKLFNETGKAGQIIITGQNANLLSVKSIIKGEQAMTVFKPLKSFAYAAADLANQLLNSKVPVLKDSIFNGKINVPSILVTVEALDKNNIDKLITEGFYSKDEIFGN